MHRQGTWLDWKQDHLARLEKWEAQGVKRFQWSSAGDKHTCPLCEARNGKIFTKVELIEILNKQFCVPGDEDDRCRCVVLAYE
jgi:hypothetical protein